jgi:predicted  nucleic acid-binding Zn-ribbon protein
MSGTEAIRKVYAPMKENLGTKIALSSFGVILAALIAFGFSDRAEIRAEISKVNKVVSDRTGTIDKVNTLERKLEGMAADLNQLVLQVTAFTSRGDRFTAQDGQILRSDFETKMLIRDEKVRETVQVQLVKVLESLQIIKDRQNEAAGQSLELANRLAMMTRDIELARSTADRASAGVDRLLNQQPRP